jgi:hypothetical protein
MKDTAYLPMSLQVARASVVVVAAALLSGSSGCGDGQQAEGGGVRAVDGADAFPSDSLRQWVSYADHVAVYSVTDESARPVDPVEIEADGGIQGRTVTLETERNLWSASGAPPLPDSFTMDALGWMIDDDGRHELTMRDAPRVEIGERYLAPLARVRDGTGELAWWPLSSGAQFPVLDGKIVPPAPDEQGWDDPLLTQLAGRSLVGLEASLDASEPLPLPAKYGNLRPFDRFQAVLEELHERETVPPGETP